MKLWVRINQLERALELKREGETCRFRFGSDEEKIAAVAEVEPGVYSVLLEGKSYEAKLESDGDRLVIGINGRRFEVEVKDPRNWNPRGESERWEGRQNVTAPMPGKVIRALVGPGDQVRVGQGLVVVEAMKMQNEMKAPKSGRVAALSVREGDTVTAGQVLAIIE